MLLACWSITLDCKSNSLNADLLTDYLLTIQIQIQNQIVVHRSVQAKNRNRRCERRLLLGVISLRSVKEFKIAFKTIVTSCRTTVKRQVIPDLWRTNRKCLVRHDEGRVRTAKQQFVRRSQCTRWHIVTNERCLWRTSALPRLVGQNRLNMKINNKV